MTGRDSQSARRILARNLRKLRLERGWSQEDLAAEAGMRQALVSAIEVGAANPTLTSLEKLAATLGITLAELFGH
ncbi:helix-turn-helix transcriptional regulator [Bradyrhizobium sp. S69]|uniref:helix-turn-helix transcriptional regulator n=1 Tax=Bradyrhizobium sp. S69 TaxID=1641856 RepID=UPI00131E872E|nr:helix-turn-helix transcriptional regulator [Bradyrhizobium sp. S69]